MRLTGRGDRGSVLILYPVGFLIVIVLGAIAADLSHLHMARRDLVELSGTLANDVATAGLDEEHFRTQEAYRIDPARADRVITQVLALDTGRRSPATLAAAAGPNPSLTCDPPAGPCRVTVTVTARVPYLFGRALPGPDHRDLVVTSQATLEET